jgi:deoxyribose-phosphate aldolase
MMAKTKHWFWHGLFAAKVRLLLPKVQAEVPQTTLPNLTRTQLAGMIDHTQLKPDANCEMIAQVCQEALTYGFAAVCVTPVNVVYCRKLLQDTKIIICTVTGFPLGAAKTRIKVLEARQGIKDGAREIDMVLNIGLMKDLEYYAAGYDISEVVRACHDKGAILKVILETCLLNDEEKVAACLLAQDAEADFVKTSTGLNGPGAAVRDVALMRSVVGPKMGVKAAGGIRDTDTALAMVAAGANRIGASASVKIVIGAGDEKKQEHSAARSN